MTGAGSNGMRLSRQGWHPKMTIAWLPLPLPLLLAGLMIASSSQAALSDSVTIMLEATFTAPPCTLEVPDKVHLGSIPYGDKSYRPFTLTVNCTSASKAEIYAQTLGTLVSGSTDTMEMGESATRFWLEEGGKKIALNGDSNTTTSGFCEGTSSRVCTLTPKTQVDASAPEGERSAIIRFNIRYKA